MCLRSGRLDPLLLRSLILVRAENDIYFPQAGVRLAKICSIVYLFGVGADVPSRLESHQGAHSSRIRGNLERRLRRCGEAVKHEPRHEEETRILAAAWTE